MVCINQQIMPVRSFENNYMHLIDGTINFMVPSIRFLKFESYSLALIYFMLK